MDNLTSLQFLFLLLSILAQSMKIPARDTFFMASIGDSWASGAAVTSHNMYDENNACHQSKVVWEVQLVEDTSWTESAIDFNFLACSGAQLVAAANPDPANSQPLAQLAGAGTSHLVSMELGGNNCHLSDIARDCIFVSGNGIEYPDPKDFIIHLVNDKSNSEFYLDHHQTLQEILDWGTIKGRNDFYLYIVGYAEFFNTSPGSDWCNSQSFGKVLHPKLNDPLRSKINQLVIEVNAQISQSIKDINNDHIQFLDPSPLFEGHHRFCEPGHTFKNQYHLNDVWFWNLSPPEDDPHYLRINNCPTLEAIWQDLWIENNIFPNGTQATAAQIEAMVSSSNPSSGGRAFTPKKGGHTAIKDGLIALLRDKAVPGVKPAVPIKPPQTQPYASGQVHIHISEYLGCLDDSDNLSVMIDMWDSAGAQIGSLPRTQAGASASAKIGSKLEDRLVVTPEWANGGYIQFQPGGLQFDTISVTDSSKPVHCNVGGYDPQKGPQCVVPGIPPSGPSYYPDAVAIAQMDCFFPAPDWHGGNPSDRSAL